MKKLFLNFTGTLLRTSICAACSLFLIGLSSCSDDDDPVPTPISNGEKAVKEVIENLESNPEVSQFLDVLKKINVSNLTEDKLTVFAVKNPSSQKMAHQSIVTRATALDSAAVMRSIAKGSYSLKELTHGMILKSISEEELHVTIDAQGFSYINGTRIEGEGTLAGSSYIYLIPEVLRKYSEIEEPGDSIETPSDSINVNDIRLLWTQSMAKQQDAYKELESQLITGFGGFDYKDIGTVAETYWNLTYKTLEEGKEYRESVAEIAEAKNLSDSIRLDLSILNTRLYGYYGKILHEEDGLSTDDSRDLIIAELQEQIERLPSALAENARLALAKVYVWSQMYVEAEHMAREIIERKAVILNEANLIAAIAQYKTGKEMEALQNINIVREALSLPTIVPPIDNDVLIETAHRCLIGDGQLYPYYRLLGKNINYMETVANFNPDRHFYLPIPQAALDTYPGLVQNAGY